MELNNKPSVFIFDKEPEPDLIIMSTWDINGQYDNKVCGHVYEVIEYYWILKDHFNTKFIFPNNVDIDKCLDKYTFTQNERDRIKYAMLPQPKNGIINTTHGLGLVLIVDGNLGNFNGIIRGIPVQFSCGKTGLFPDKRKFDYPVNLDWYLIHDFRIEPNPLENYDHPKINNMMKEKILPTRIYPYTKKLLLSYLDDSRIERSYEILNSYQPESSIYMLYLTGNCRRLSPDELNEQIKANTEFYNKILIFTDYFIDVKKIDHPQDKIEVVYIDQPVNIFKYRWTTYLYTPLKRQWDCSNRLMVECMFHNRYFVISEKLGYEDLALKTRRSDTIETSKFMQGYGIHKNAPYYKDNTLSLSKEDKIIGILESILNDVYEKRGRKQPYKDHLHHIEWGTPEDTEKLLERLFNNENE